MSSASFRVDAYRERWDWPLWLASLIAPLIDPRSSRQLLTSLKSQGKIKHLPFWFNHCLGRDCRGVVERLHYSTPWRMESGHGVGSP